MRKLDASRTQETRLQAIDAILKLDKKAAVASVPDLARCVNDKDHDIRVAALNAIVEIALESKLPCPRVFVDSLFHDDADIRQLSAMYIDCLKSTPAEFTPQLLKAMTHHDPQVRVHLADALRLAGAKDDRTIPALRKAMSDNDLMVAYNASLAFYRATGELGEVLPNWLKLADQNWYVLPPKDALPEYNVVEEAPKPESIVGRAAAYAVQNAARETPEKVAKALLPLLEDVRPRLRRSSARAVGLMAGDSLQSRDALDRLEARAALGKLRSDKVKSVRDAAEVALERFAVDIAPPAKPPKPD